MKYNDFIIELRLKKDTYMHNLCDEIHMTPKPQKITKRKNLNFYSSSLLTLWQHPEGD